MKIVKLLVTESTVIHMPNKRLGFDIRSYKSVRKPQITHFQKETRNLKAQFTKYLYEEVPIQSSGKIQNSTTHLPRLVVFKSWQYQVVAKIWSNGNSCTHLWRGCKWIQPLLEVCLVESTKVEHTHIPQPSNAAPMASTAVRTLCVKGKTWSPYKQH